MIVIPWIGRDWDHLNTLESEGMVIMTTPWGVPMPSLTNFQGMSYIFGVCFCEGGPQPYLGLSCFQELVPATGPSAGGCNERGSKDSQGDSKGRLNGREAGGALAGADKSLEPLFFGLRKAPELSNLREGLRNEH